MLRNKKRKARTRFFPLFPPLFYFFFSELLIQKDTLPTAPRGISHLPEQLQAGICLLFPGVLWGAGPAVTGKAEGAAWGWLGALCSAPGDANPAALPKSSSSSAFPESPSLLAQGFPWFIKAPSILGRKRLVCSAAPCPHKPGGGRGRSFW